MNEATKDQIIEAMKANLEEKAKLIDWIISEANAKERKSNMRIAELLSENALLKELCKQDEY